MQNEEPDEFAEGLVLYSELIERMRTAAQHTANEGLNWRAIQTFDGADVIEMLVSAIHQTLTENLHLADGTDCTLRHLVAALKGK